MQIEVATKPNQTTKAKGDLLENLAKELLEVQNYQIIEEIRNTGVELDLLAKHNVNGRTIYIECKAHASTLGANYFFNLYGKTLFKKYSEGWLVLTGPLGKETKGVVEEWEGRPQDERERISIYSAGRIVDQLISARILEKPSRSKHQDLQQPGETTVYWVLLVTELGRFWAAPILRSGITVGVRVLDAGNCEIVADKDLLQKLNDLESSYQDLDFLFESSAQTGRSLTNQKQSIVIEVSQAEVWRDYRPSRPEDFVGRQVEIDQVFGLMHDVMTETTRTRAFALTGDTGMGKSSMIAKLRSTRKKNIFIYAVDCRAATDGSYITAALLNGLREASKIGFGKIPAQEIQIDDPSNPLNSNSVVKFLNSLDKNSCVSIVFDQFEELYAKTELRQVFDEARKLLLSATSCRSNIVIGFAWRSDTTIPLGHPAYHLWHQLSDQRLEIPLRPLEPKEINSAITIFEKELSGKLRPDVKQQVVENSQGYPWLLKEICINLQDQIERGAASPEAIETLEVQDLFEAKVKSLQANEISCLKHVAKKSPADWTEILDLYGQTTVQGLQEKKYLIRSGDRVVIYWDIFRDFINYGTAPQVPISYFPKVPISSMITVGCALKKSEPLTILELSEIVTLSENTIGNVVRDLRMFGIATGKPSLSCLSESLEENSPIELARQIRNVFHRHAICTKLVNASLSKNLTYDEYIDILSKSPALRRHKRRSIRQIGNIFANWLSTAGFMNTVGAGLSFKDFGDINLSYASRKRRVGRLFSAAAPPHRVLEVLERIQEHGILTSEEARQPGYLKALDVLSLFELAVQFENSSWKVVTDTKYDTKEGAATTLFYAAREQESVRSAVQFIQKKPDSDGIELAAHVAEEFGETWAYGSLRRTGNALMRWANWVYECEKNKRVEDPLKGIKGKRARLDDETIEQAKKDLDSGKTKVEIALSLGVSTQTVSRWFPSKK